jgi:hypothetical protein
MDLTNFTLNIKQQPLSPEESARMQTAWNKMRQVWQEPVTITFTLDPVSPQEEANTVESTATVLPLDEEQAK